MIKLPVCEYGLPKCGKSADFSISGGSYGMLCNMYSCCDHVFQMATTGRRPHPITNDGGNFSKLHKFDLIPEV